MRRNFPFSGCPAVWTLLDLPRWSKLFTLGLSHQQHGSVAEIPLKKPFHFHFSLSLFTFHIHFSLSVFSFHFYFSLFIFIFTFTIHFLFSLFTFSFHIHFHFSLFTLGLSHRQGSVAEIPLQKPCSPANKTRPPWSRMRAVCGQNCFL